MSYSFFKSKVSLGSLRFSFFSLSRSWQQWQAGEWDSAPPHSSYSLLHSLPTPNLSPQPLFLLENVTSKWDFRLTRGKRNMCCLKLFFTLKASLVTTFLLEIRGFQRWKVVTLHLKASISVQNEFNLTDIHIFFTRTRSYRVGVDPCKYVFKTIWKT